MILKNIVFWILTVIWMAVIFYLSSIPDLASSLPSVWDTIFRKLAHITEFGILAMLLSMALDGRQTRLVLVFVIAFLFANSDEWHQSYVAGRTGSGVDVMIDSLGIILGILLIKKIRGQTKVVSD